MAKDYSEKSFLLEIDDYSLVEQYLRTRTPSITDFSYAKPTGRRKNIEATVGQIEQALHKQKEELQREMEADFKRINNLSNENGSQNLMTEAAEQGITATAGQVIDNPYDRALWFLLNHPSVFEQADAVQQFYDLNGWKRVPVPTKPISFVLGKKDALINAIKKHYGDNEARGKYGDIEMYAKADRVYIVARLTNYAESDYVPNEQTGGLTKQGTRRPLFEVYYLYRPNEGEKGGGELEIKARGGWQKQHALLEVFTKTVFGIALDDTKQTFNLELLKNQNFSLATDPTDGVEWWWLKALELRTPDRMTRIKITVSDSNRSGVAAMWDQLKRLNLTDTIKDMLINSADFQIKFKPPYRKYQKGTATFYINWKDSCSLNSIDDFNIKARAVLKHSKLDRGFGN